MGKRRENDPIADYIEWSNHRYNPGYYLGGTIPPWLRNLDRNPQRRRRVGITMLISTAISAVALVAFVPATGGLTRPGLALWVAIVALFGWVSVTLFRPVRRSARRRRRGRGRR